MESGASGKYKEPKRYGADINYPEEVVIVHVEGEYIETVPLQLLRRFSRGAFENTEPLYGLPDKYKKRVAKKEKYDEDMARSKTEGSKNGTTIAVAEGSTTPQHSSWREKKKEVDLVPNEGSTKAVNILTTGMMIEHPSVHAFRFAFKWMELASRCKKDNETGFFKPPEYGGKRPDLIPLNRLIDLYAASICLDLRPWPRHLRGHLLYRMTKGPPALADMKYIYHHLPIENTIVISMIASYLKFRKMGSYTQPTITQIEMWIHSLDDEMTHWFKKMCEHDHDAKKREIKILELEKELDEIAKHVSTALKDLDDADEIKELAVEDLDDAFERMTNTPSATSKELEEAEAELEELAEEFFDAREDIDSDADEAAYLTADEHQKVGRKARRRKNQKEREEKDKGKDVHGRVVPGA